MAVEARAHPRGDRGSKISISEIIKRVERGRLEPKTRAWSVETLKIGSERLEGGNLAGPRADKIAQAKIILDRLRAERIYVDDPTDSDWMPSSACTLEGCHGLKFLGEDCDGLLIAYLSAVESIGCEASLIAHGYDRSNPSKIDHVLAGIYDRPRKRWLRCDPSTKQPFGTVSTPVHERIVLIPGGKVLCDHVGGFCDGPTLARAGAVRENLRPQGDFVGVARPFDGSVGQSDEPVETKGEAIQVMGEVSAAMHAAMLREIKEILTALAVQYEGMIDRHAELEGYSRLTGDPFIVEPSTTDQNRWTQKDEDDYKRLVLEVPVLMQYLYEASEGKREIAWDEDHDQVVIFGKEGEPALADIGGTPTLVDTSGAVSGTTGFGQVAIVLIVAGAVIVVGMLQAWAVHKITDATRELARSWLIHKMDEVDKKLVDQGVPVDEVRARRRELLEAVQKTSETKGEETGSEILDVAKVGLYTAMALGAGYVIVQAINAFKPARAR